MFVPFNAIGESLISTGHLNKRQLILDACPAVKGSLFTATTGMEEDIQGIKDQNSIIYSDLDIYRGSFCLFF